MYRADRLHVLCVQSALLERERRCVAERERSLALGGILDDLRAIKAMLLRGGGGHGGGGVDGGSAGDGGSTDSQQRWSEAMHARLTAWEQQLSDRAEYLSTEHHVARVSAAAAPTGARMLLWCWCERVDNHVDDCHNADVRRDQHLHRRRIWRCWAVSTGARLATCPAMQLLV
jgi:hypothetical protein